MGTVLGHGPPGRTDPVVERHAGRLARTCALRAGHLAYALAIADPNLVIAVWDQMLHAGDATAGLHTAPAHLHAP